MNRILDQLNGTNGKVAHANGAALNGTARNGPPASQPPLTTVADGDSKPPTAGRDAGGKFAPGNKLGRGNPFYRRLCQMRQAVLEAVGEDGLRQLARKLLEQALAGDVAAARTLLMYLVGKPGPAADPDRADLHEFGCWPSGRPAPSACGG